MAVSLPMLYHPGHLLGWEILILIRAQTAGLDRTLYHRDRPQGRRPLKLCSLSELLFVGRQRAAIRHIHQYPLSGFVDAKFASFLIDMGNHQPGHFLGAVSKSPLSKAFLL